MQNKKSSFVGVLSASVAHELRNPLSVIRTAVYNIKRKRKDASQDKHIANIEKKIFESEQIIVNLLSFSRIKMPVFKNVDVKVLLESCVLHTREKYVNCDVCVDFECSKKNATVLNADPVHMTELFSNILDNCFQAFNGEKGRISVSLEFDSSEDAVCIIKFKDNGKGISKEELLKIFNPFYTNKPKGAGLGLSICSQLVDLHDGKIDIKSKPGKGTKVTVFLPAERSQKT